MKLTLSILVLSIFFFNAYSQKNATYNYPNFEIDNLVKYEVKADKPFLLYEKFDKKEIKSFDANIIKAFEKINTKDFKEASKLFGKYLENPTDNDKLNYFCNYFKGYSHYMIFQYKEAKASFLNAEKYNKEDYNLYFNLGVVEYKLTNWSESIKYFSQAIKLNTSDADAYACRAKAYFFGNNLDNSVKDYLTALKIAPSTDLYVYLIGITYLFRGNTYYNANDTSYGGYYIYIAQQSQPLQVLLKLSEDMFRIKSVE